MYIVYYCLWLFSADDTKFRLTALVNEPIQLT